jgi:hypothetical protein
MEESFEVNCMYYPRDVMKFTYEKSGKYYASGYLEGYEKTLLIEGYENGQYQMSCRVSEEQLAALMEYLKRVTGGK